MPSQEQSPLSIEQSQKTVDTIVVACFGQNIGLLGGGDQSILRLQLLTVGRTGCQLIGNLLKGNLQHLLIGRRSDPLFDLGDLKADPELAAIEDRHGYRRSKGPGITGARLEQPLEAVAGQTKRTGQRDGRKECSTGSTDISIGRLELILGLADIGTGLENL